MKLKKRNTSKKGIIIKLLVLSLYIAWLVVYFQWGVDSVYLSLLERNNIEHQQLASRIESARKEIASIPNLIGEREQQFAHAQQLLAIEQDEMPSVLNINHLIRTIVEVADQCQVEAIPLRTTSPESQIINEYHYSRQHIFLTVKGDFQNIAKFVDNLDGKDISTATVTDIFLQRSDNDSDNLTIQNDAASVSGTLELIIYTRSLD